MGSIITPRHSHLQFTPSSHSPLYPYLLQSPLTSSHSISRHMNARLITNPLQSLECNLEQIHEDKTVSSDSVEEPESLEYPTFLAIDIEESRTSDEEIRNFLRSLATYTQDTKHIAPHVFNRVIEILKKLQLRIFKSNRSRADSTFIFPSLDQVADIPRFEAWTLHLLLSAQNTRLSAAVLDVFRDDIPGSSRKDIAIALLSGFIPSLLSAMGGESLLMLPLSDPLHNALFAFLAQLIDTLKQFPPSTVATSSEELASQIHDHLLVPIRPLLIRHLKSPTPTSNNRNYNIWWSRLFENSRKKDQIPPYYQDFAFLHVLRQCANLRQSWNDFSAFLTGLMKEVWEERRKEGLVDDAVLPPFMSTPLRNNMTPHEMITLLDSASAFLASTPRLSDADAVSVTLFLTSFDNMIFVKSKKGKDAFSSAFVSSLSSCPPFAMSVATLMLLSLTCSQFGLREERIAFWTFCIFRKRGNVKSVVNSEFFTTLAEALQKLQSDWSDDTIHSIHVFFADVVQLILEAIAPWRFTLHSNSKIQEFQHIQKKHVNNVLVPLRQSLVHCARTNNWIVHHFELLSCPDLNHPDTLPFFEGVWEEVRQEAIGLVCGDDRAAAPVFLTMNLFSHMSMEDTQSGMSSLSSYLSATPSPPPPVTSIIRLFLSTIATASSLSLSEQMNRMISLGVRKDYLLQDWIRSHRNFASCFAQTIPTLFITTNREICYDVQLMVEAVLESSKHFSEIVMSLTEAGFVSNMAQVLMETRTQANNDSPLRDDNTQCFLTVLSACLNCIPSSVPAYHSDKLRGNKRRARLLVEKKVLFEAVGKAEWLCPVLTETLAKCGFHVAAMRLCDLAEKNEHQVWLLSLFGHENPNSKLLDYERRFYYTRKPSSSKRTALTLRERMKGQNEEGLEDLIEKNLFGPDLSRPNNSIPRQAKQCIINTGFNGWRI
ncbi:hypothetical protein BLNAU_11154 [Blattamonas nauphoetae]|uniref:Uncharacterized protein n=1 Tax=Blattamonas nauphoetae TaxID=2049346 RepID=A0ABQ9XQP6_9EUKA|nr:hypothetical protein BLNAU_11154 [Blattamonas nauphoetae]